MFNEFKANLYDAWYPIKNKIEEFIAWEYLYRAKRRFLKQVKGQKIELNDLNKGGFRCTPRWHLIMNFDSEKAYKDFLKTDVFDTQTFFYDAVRSNGRAIVFVKKEDGKTARYIY